MALGLHFLHVDSPNVTTLQYAVRQRGGDTYFDFAAAGSGTGQTFTASPASKWQPLSQSALTDEAGFYWVLIEPLPAAFTNDEYYILVRDSSMPRAVGAGIATVYALDDAPVFPGTGPGGAPTSTDNAAAVWSYAGRHLTGAGLNAVLIDGLPLPTALVRLVTERAGEWDQDPTSGLVTYLGPSGVARMTVTPASNQRKPAWIDPALPGD